MLLRKHGKNILLHQFAQCRLANIAIDIIALCAMLSRTSSMLQQDATCNTSQLALQMTEAFAFDAQQRIDRHLNALDHNNDNAIQNICHQMNAYGKYPYDTLKA